MCVSIIEIGAEVQPASSKISTICRILQTIGFGHESKPKSNNQSKDGMDVRSVAIKSFWL
jgi:hypothetical protein